jgi:succinate-semialdehyde dehydrogenase / glutarate-semialdehyde dehydrogenase
MLCLTGVSAAQRNALLRRWYELILEHQDDLAAIPTLEQGKPYAEARAEIAYGAAFIEWFAEEGKRAYGDVIMLIGSSALLADSKSPMILNRAPI